MRDFAWIRGVMRLMGLFLVFSSLPMTAQSIASLTYTVRFVPQQSPGLWWYYVVSIGSNLLVTVFGMYLLFGGRVLLKWLTRDLHKCCQNCGYAVQGLAAAVCPECGEALPFGNDSNGPLSPSPERPS